MPSSAKAANSSLRRISANCVRERLGSCVPTFPVVSVTIYTWLPWACNIASVPWQSASSSAWAPINIAVLPVHFSIGVSGFGALSCPRRNGPHAQVNITQNPVRVRTFIFPPPSSVDVPEAFVLNRGQTATLRQRERHHVVALLRSQF